MSDEIVTYVAAGALYLAVCVVTGWAATIKGRSFGLGFVVSFFVTPIAGMILVALVPAEKARPR